MTILFRKIKALKNIKNIYKEHNHIMKLIHTKKRKILFYYEINYINIDIDNNIYTTLINNNIYYT